MDNLFEATRRESAVDIVVNSIKQLLMDRKLKPGDRLPNELEISEGLNVSRGSVREAMKILSAFGLVEVKVGNGTFVSQSPGDNIMDSLLFSFFVTNPKIEDLTEFRKLFEVDILKLIIEHYDENQPQRHALKENLMELSELMQHQTNLDAFYANDIGFHRILGSATNNLIAERIYIFVIDFMNASIKSTHKLQKGQIAFDVHKNIIDVIETKSMDRIQNAIDLSVNTWYQLVDQLNEENGVK